MVSLRLLTVASCSLQAKRVVDHLNKRSAAAGEGGETFVWGKKIDQQLHNGVSVKEITAKLGRDQLEERRVSAYQSACT